MRSVLRVAALLLCAVSACAPAQRGPAPAVAATGDSRQQASGDTGEASAYFVVLTTRSEAELHQLVVPDRLALSLRAQHCGDASACEAVRQLLRAPGQLIVGVDPATEVPMPRGSLFEHACASLDEQDRIRVKQLPRAVYIEARGPAFPHQVPARAAFAAAAALAQAVDGIVLDPVAIRYETASQFARRTIRAPWDKPALTMAQVTVHVVQAPGEAVSLDTAGLSRFGLPELEVAELTHASVNPMAAVLNTIAYKLAISGPANPVSFTLRDISEANQGPLPPDEDPSRQISVPLQPVPRTEGEPGEFVLRIAPPGSTTTQGYAVLLDQIFGASDQVRWVKHNDAILAASARARSALPGVLERFRQASEAGAELLVKLPFPVPDHPGQHEWMWIEMLTWDDTTISGLLVNQPELIPQLRLGARVSGSRADVFDYLLRMPGRRTEGGETDELLNDAPLSGDGR